MKIIKNLANWIGTLAIATTSIVALAGDSTPPAADPFQSIKSALGFVPGFMKPYHAPSVAAAWDHVNALEFSDTTAIPNKYKELIGLAVASQIPCKYCIYASTKEAKHLGASDQEIQEAVMMAGLARHWSTVFNGMNQDYDAFRGEVDKMIEHLKKSADSAAPAEPPKDVYEEITIVFGFVPTFVKDFPAAALPAAWEELKAVELNPNSAIPDKYKSLISLAVAAQIPCRYCVYSDTQFAKLGGATDQEVGEAVALSALTRQWSTYFNGMQIDEAGFRRDIDRLSAPEPTTKAKKK